MKRVHGILLLLTAGFLGGCGEKDEGGPDTVARMLSDDSVPDLWVYDDLPTGLARAADTGKPLLVVFRCVP